LSKIAEKFYHNIDPLIKAFLRLQAKQKIRQFSQQHHQQQDHSGQEETEVAESKAEKAAAALTFEPKVVVQFSVDEPIFDVDSLKKKIKAAVMEPVKYIDARPGDGV
jgi:hypothetical protein